MGEIRIGGLEYVFERITYPDISENLISYPAIELPKPLVASQVNFRSHGSTYNFDIIVSSNIRRYNQACTRNLRKYIASHPRLELVSVRDTLYVVKDDVNEKPELEYLVINGKDTNGQRVFAISAGRGGTRERHIEDYSFFEDDVKAALDIINNTAALLLRPSRKLQGINAKGIPITMTP
jgi:hypothetical protein